MSKFSQLLAKRTRSGEPIQHLATLAGHLQSVYAAAESIIRSTSGCLWQAFGLGDEFAERFHRIVALAAALHDVGKANNHFLGMLNQSPDRIRYDYRQAIRHEWLTWWWLHQPEIRDWAKSILIEPDDWYIVVCCVAGHHPKPNRATPPGDAEHAGSKIQFLSGHADFRQITDWLAATFHCETPASTTDDLLLNVVHDNLIEEIHRQVVDVQAFIAGLGCSEKHDWRRLCASAKACLVAADVAGSALSEQLTNIDDHSNWIVNTLSARPSPGDIEQLVRERLGGHDERPFQSQVSRAAARVSLVTAGCGSGKTVAAWLWAARQCPNQRVYFCYPTTGTATEGFRGYLFDDQTAASKLGAKLFHSRASIDFDVILSAEQDEDEPELQVFSLQSWGTPLVCCTVDTVLGIMQNHRRGLYAWPALAQAAFVFDEIHAYDDKLFGSLLQFLDKLSGLRVLLMTASLPTPRRQAIEEILTEQDDELQIIRGPEELEQLPRYHCESVGDGLFQTRSPDDQSGLIGEDLRQRVLDEIAAGGRVLWICNVVDRAMAVADIFSEVAPLIYHSRFRYEDRVEQHRAVGAAFDRNATQGCLAVCTQVAEMSLDISATLLVSEICPVPSLIQRLGRLNRHATPPEAGKEKPPTLPFVIVEPRKDDGSLQVMPYDEKTYGDWAQQTKIWLNELGTKDISQHTLAEAWEKLGADESPPPRGGTTWVEGGPATQVAELRKSSPGVTVVLPGDDATLVAEQKSQLMRVAIPMPSPPACFDLKPPQPAAVYVVPPDDLISYSKDRGAQWNRLTASE